MNMINRSAPVFIAGHKGLVGSAIVRRLELEGFTNLLTATRDDLDLRRQSSVDEWFSEHKPQYVFLAAGTVGLLIINIVLRPFPFCHSAWF